MEKRLQLLAGLHQSMELISRAVEFRQNSSITQGVLDRNTCDACIQQSVIVMRDILTELKKG